MNGGRTTMPTWAASVGKVAKNCTKICRSVIHKEGWKTNGDYCGVWPSRRAPPFVADLAINKPWCSKPVGFGCSVHMDQLIFLWRSSPRTKHMADFSQTSIAKFMINVSTTPYKARGQVSMSSCYWGSLGGWEGSSRDDFMFQMHNHI